MDGCHEVDSGPVVTGGDAPEILEASEHALDDVTVPVEVGREAVFPALVGAWWNVGRGSRLFDLPANGGTDAPMLVNRLLSCFARRFAGAEMLVDFPGDIALQASANFAR